ncbi:MAG: rRNA adenine N-6-methyltransferase family protein [Candidatus Woesearchaeota archaeon]
MKESFPKKEPLHHDQHFLIDKEVLSASLKAAELKKVDVVLEIGPGKGILTAELAKKCQKVIAIEIDESLKDKLSCLPKNVEIIFGNALELMEDQPFNKLVANIPYAISEPLFKKLLKMKFDLAVLLVGESFYLLLEEISKWSVIGRLFFDISKVMDVSRNCFDPKPRVDSVLMKIEPRKKELTDKEKILKELVLQEDKKLKNALMFSIMRVKNLTKKQAKEIIDKILFPKELWNKRVTHLSNVQFRLFYEKMGAI